MNHWGKRSHLALWNIFILGLFASGCSLTPYPDRVVRKPVPTLSHPIQNDSTADGKGTIRVGRGDTLYTLARQHGVALRGLIQANRLQPPYLIYPGQRLMLPISRFHMVSRGETVYQIARHYDVDMGSLVRINFIEPPYRVTPGQRLRLPDSSKLKIASADRMSPPQRGARDERPQPQWVSVSRQRNTDPAPIKNPPARTARKFLWPLRGKVIEPFGARAGGLYNDGINIAARKGASIRAAENGVVAYTGNQLQGFGNLVLVKHAGGWMSAYAHSSVVLVKRGDIVRRGQVIARVGRTGNVSRPQLHFELRQGDRAVDPTNHLVRIARLMPGSLLFADLSPARRNMF